VTYRAKWRKPGRTARDLVLTAPLTDLTELREAKMRSTRSERASGDARVPVRPRDWIALPTGPEHAHQMVNVSAAEPLVYLCISTMLGAEIVEYPDSGKVNARVADPTSPVGFRRIGMFRADSGTLDYWESEPEAG